MKIIAYGLEGCICTKSFSDPDAEVNFPHIVLDQVPSESIESWYIDGNEIKIDQVKLAQFNRERMPNLTPIEFDTKLKNNGLYATVQELIKDNFEMRIAYNRATFFSRTDYFVDQARIALKLTDEQVDSMWIGN